MDDSDQNTAGSVDELGSDPFHIPATTSILERRPRILKDGDLLGIFDHFGDMGALEDRSEGLFFQDTRHINQFQFRINGQRPLLLSSAVEERNILLRADLTNPDFYDGSYLYLPRDTIHIARTIFLSERCRFERLVLRNFGMESCRFTVQYSYESDFVDIFQVRGHQRHTSGTLRLPCVGPNEVTLEYVGVDSVVRQTRIHFSQRPSVLDERSASFEFALERGQSCTLHSVVACNQPSKGDCENIPMFSQSLRRVRQHYREWSDDGAEIVTSSTSFNNVLKGSKSDLAMLCTRTPHGDFPYAGIPWFSTAFGRDSIITAMQLLWMKPDLAKGVLLYLAASQSKTVDEKSDAQPGKILHESRRGEMAASGEVPFGLYYGSADSTPLFVILAGLYLERTNDLDTIREIWPNIRAAMRWIDEYGDINDDGFVEYPGDDGGGLRNQGWKDSGDSVFHKDGRFAEGPISLCEVQAYVYSARHHMAEIARRLTFPRIAPEQERAAELLRENFEARFWCEELDLYAIALDGNHDKCEIRASNAGHALFSGIASPSRAKKIVETLMRGDFFSGWGIRTLAKTESRYNPMSYHNGSVWPHDNALIAAGFSRYGYTDVAAKILTAIFEMATYMDRDRLPELICGFARRPNRGPTFYPVACAPQAWASGTPFSLLQSCLGLTIDPRHEQVVLNRPRLPDFLDRVDIRSLPLGQSTIDIRLNREELGVSARVIRGNRECNVLVFP